MHYQWEHLMNEQLQCTTKSDFLQQKLLVGRMLQPNVEKLLDSDTISKGQYNTEITNVRSASSNTFPKTFSP